MDALVTTTNLQLHGPKLSERVTFVNIASSFSNEAVFQPPSPTATTDEVENAGADLWKWRGEYADADPETSQCRFEAILKARLRQNYPIVEASFLMDGAQPVRRAATSVVNSLSALHTDFVLSIIPKGITYVLLFDDGSRGNPGPGGSGTVILKIVAGDTAATPVWLTSMSYGAVSTTNNKTENRGLLNGLSHAKSDNLRPLHVFGDSKMIITQMLTSAASIHGRVISESSIKRLMH
ncbi:hypothetical protein PC122_g22048 [Phytophthora cactorum]|nr:hypothetical protein PC122_g22048 [Phytophthora cactorum]